MSMIVCDRCDRYINSDDDPDCFVSVTKKMQTVHEEVMCEPCRFKHIEEPEGEI